MHAIAALLLLAAAPTTVEQSHKNIKVLQGTPSSQLIPIMAFMSNSLGVTCAHCHGAAWESDEKPAKEAARRMIVLQRDINARYYDGKPVVTCNSCHRGDAQTAAVPDIVNVGWSPKAAPATQQPGVAAEDAVQRLPKAPEGVTRRILRGTVERFNGRSEPVSGPFTLTFDGDQVKYDTELSHPPEATRALAVYTFAPLAIVERVRGERWIFDQRGVLKRRTRETATPLGTLPEQIDYEDFRSFQGAPTPYLARWSRADYRVTFTINEIEDQRPHLQVLKGVPESQLFLLMNTIGDSLGVHCDYCHAKEGDKWMWDSDAKPAKAVGRDMMRMTLAMNAAHFGGRTAVTCYTCHHGSLRAERIPPLPPHRYATDPPPRALPSAATVIDHYRNAIGSVRAGEPLEMTLKGTVDRIDHPGPFEMALKGEKVHISAGGGTQDLEGDRAKGIVELFQPMKVAGDPAQMRVAGIATIDGRDAYEVESGNRRYFFDADSGLLVRRIILTETQLGPIPEQVDFGDYRPVGGVMLPFMVRTSDAAAWDTAVRRFSEISYGSGGASRQ
jgi:hypothetical protein